ncbi:hypothetical protein [Rhodococcus sp. MALMAid1271]|uniref:hypothetical protein n=1 Tax=Rhodococcus sp. MALMAid1271 TaxID=3411744 RepID=UPI003BA252F5
MTMSNNAFDELDVKVQRAQAVVREIRGVGRDGGTAVEVDSSHCIIRMPTSSWLPIEQRYATSNRNWTKRCGIVTIEVMLPPST